MSLTRRTFLAASGALVASACAAANDEATLPIIDTHQHLWDLDKFTLPWLKKGEGLGKNFLTADYLKAVEGLNVVQAIYMEVDVAPDQKVAEAEYVLGLTKDKRNLTTAAVIGGRPADPGFQEYVTRFKDEPRVIGVRQVMNGAKAGDLIQKDFVRGVQTLGTFGKSFDICTQPQWLGEAEQLVAACPDTAFILDHCGNGSVAAFREKKQKEIDQYRRDIAALAKHDRVVCKISGIGVQLAGKDWGFDALAPVINVCLDTFGPDRVLFAGDWPVCTLGVSLKQWVNGVKEVVSNRPLADQKKLFHDNAAKRLAAIRA